MSLAGIMQQVAIKRLTAEGPQQVQHSMSFSLCRLLLNGLDYIMMHELFMCAANCRYCPSCAVSAKFTIVKDLVLLRFWNLLILQQMRADFKAELAVLSHLRHVNIVPIVAFSRDPVCIIYPYMANGSLHEHLRSEQKRHAMCWQQRVKILADINAGLAHLHAQVTWQHCLLGRENGTIQ